MASKVFLDEKGRLKVKAKAKVHEAKERLGGGKRKTRRRNQDAREDGTVSGGLFSSSSYRVLLRRGKAGKTDTFLEISRITKKKVFARTIKMTAHGSEIVAIFRQV